MSPNSIHPQLSGAPSSESFARRRLQDIAGLVAIFSVAFAVALVTGTDTPAFALALVAALGGLAYGEQRLRGAETQLVRVRAHPLHGRHVRV